MGKPKKVVKRSNIMNRRKPSNKTKTKPKKKPTKLLKGGGFADRVNELIKKNRENTITPEELEELKKLEKQAKEIKVQRKASVRRAQERQQTAATATAAADARQMIKEQEKLKREEHKALVDNQTKYIDELKQSLINIDNENTRIKSLTSHPSSGDLVFLLTEKYEEIKAGIENGIQELRLLGIPDNELTKAGLETKKEEIDTSIRQWEIYSSHLEQLILLNESIEETKVNITQNDLEKAQSSVDKSNHLIGSIEFIQDTGKQRIYREDKITDATLITKIKELKAAAEVQDAAYNTKKKEALEGDLGAFTELTA